MSSSTGVWTPRRPKVVETDIPARIDRVPWSLWRRLADT
jgi:hypothetical protein